MTPSNCGILYWVFFPFYQVSPMFNVNPWHRAWRRRTDEEKGVLFVRCISLLVPCNSHFIILPTTINTHNAVGEL